MTLYLAAAGALVAAMNHFGVAHGYADGARSLEDLALALANQSIGLRWAAFSGTLALVSAALGKWPMRGSKRS
ncbi:hypothetical protein [Isoptericola sp. NPDC055881]